MKKIVLYPHGGSGNRGCEAIVRGTKKILDDYDLQLFSSGVQQDIDVHLNDICSVNEERKEIKRISFNYLKAFFSYHILNDKSAFDKVTFSNVIQASKNTISLSIGGDNYCYGDQQYIYLVNREAKKNGAKTVLWGCSVEKKNITESMKKDLESYDLIVARESITYDSLIKINCHTVLYPDPAFQLPIEKLPLPKEFSEDNTVGINISPMIIDNENQSGMTLKNYIQLIQYIIDHTNMQIALIPHVIWNFNDDRKPINLLYDMFKESGRLVKIDGYSASKMKGYISRCRFFIGARTHSTIAAYSTCVPTLVVGYSVKAKGIAKDIFGTFDNYVIPVQSLQNECDLTNSFKWLMENETKIKNHLKEFMPQYCAKALEAKREIDKL